jgi:succinate dehydrogenase / fumarate reductase membrane anchor subunit
MSLESPLGKFLGLGSAKEGTRHWWSQRVTAIALVPLTLWFVVALLAMESFAYADIVAWIGHPINAILLILLVGVVLNHSLLGIQVVVEDYVHASGAKVTTLLLLKFAHFLIGVAAVYSIIIISVGTASFGTPQ